MSRHILVHTLVLLGCAAALPCRDTAEPNHCAEWSAKGECATNSAYMHQHCRMSCELCMPMDPLQLLTDVDKDNSGTISKSELQARHSIIHAARMAREAKERETKPPKEMPSADAEEEKKDFAAMDTDGNGFLNANETSQEYFEEGMDDQTRMDLTIEQEYDTLMFKYADKNNDGLLTPQEYVLYRHEDFDALPPFQELMRKQELQYVERQFKKWDEDNSGDLDEEEVFEAVESGLADFTHPDDIKDEL
jgi:Ca2+-binding EF-hand superfamily protein